MSSPFDDACLIWTKSTHSTGSSNDCVEVAHIPGVVGIRDSKNPTGSKLSLGTGAARAFAAGIKAGQLDR